MTSPIPTGSYSSKEEALTAFRKDYDNVKDGHAVHCSDIDCWIHSDEAYQCGQCGDFFWDGLEIREDGLCVDCWDSD